MAMLYDRPNAVDFYALRSGAAGILQTARLMRDLVIRYKCDPEIRSTALAIVRPLHAKDEEGEINAIFHYVRDGIRYVKDIYNVETVHTPPKILEIGQGDCDDKSVLLATLLESIGYETAFKITGYHGTDYEHVYVWVRGVGISCHLDATEPEEMGWEAPGATTWAYVQ